MLRSIRALTFAAVVGLALGATSLEAQSLSLGLKGGVALSNVTDLDSTSSGTGFAGGAYLGIGLTSITIQPEVLYVQRKFSLPGIGTQEQEFTSNYIDIPLVIGFRLGTPMVAPMIYVAPTASFETTCSIEEAASVDCSDLSIDTKSTLWSIGLGGSIDLAVGPILLTGDVRYDIGLTKIQEGEDSKWNTWLFMVGAGFRIGG